MSQPIKGYPPFGLQRKSGDPIGRGGCEINFHFGAERPLHRLAFDVIIVHFKSVDQRSLFSRLHAQKVSFSIFSGATGTKRTPMDEGLHDTE
jgi:hypothetical protein